MNTIVLDTKAFCKGGYWRKKSGGKSTKSYIVRFSDSHNFAQNALQQEWGNFPFAN